MARGLPTTKAGVETAVLIGFVGWRIAVLAQIVPSAPRGVEVSPHPGWYLAAIAVVMLASAASCATGVLRRHAIGPVWTWCELIGVCALMLATPLLVPQAHRIGTWIAFQAGLAHGVMSTACTILIGARRRPWMQVLTAIGLTTVCYLLAEIPSSPPDRLGTALSNALTYPAAGIVLASAAQYMRRLAANADDARAEAARAAARAAAAEERQRNQLLMHDSASIMRMLADGIGSPALEQVLRRQAMAEADRIRQFLTNPTPTRAHYSDNHETRRAASASTVAHAVYAASTGFTDLPIDFVMDLGGSTPLSKHVAEVVTGAVRALLHNIRLHADARNVTIHTDFDDGTDLWEISVRDDGRGFDTASINRRFGLNVQAGSALAECGVSARVSSELGEGTVAILRGPARTP